MPKCPVIKIIIEDGETLRDGLVAAKPLADILTHNGRGGVGYDLTGTDCTAEEFFDELCEQARPTLGSLVRSQDHL